MDWIINSQDYLGLLAVPIAISTVRSLIKNWSTLWDNNLTEVERTLLLRMALFVIMPIIVLFHECGHAAATLWFGGTVEKFHYGFLWGYVVPGGTFSDWQLLMIYLAGNAVEIAIGFMALVIAVLSSSPPVVALGVYVGFWAIAGTLIFYTILSFMGAYGDWIAIYSSPEHAWVAGIAFVHFIIVAAIIYLAYAEAPMLWFARKTNPKMVQPEKDLLAEISHQPTMDSYLALAWLYFQYGVNKASFKWINMIEKIAPKEPSHLLLKGYLQSSQGQSDRAISTFYQCTASVHATDLLRARAYMAIGSCETRNTEIKYRGAKPPIDSWKAAIDAYTIACNTKEDLGDPHYYRALLYTRQGLDNLAEVDLITVLQSQCLDTNLFDRAQAELVRLRAPQVPAQ
ncbi:MAG: hypothetical protein P4L53_22240 [Candidatus Obscuribacterales bacterium]|nr:hypothetical protein [Candidatus Obscuribacterales bacterium]